MAFSTGLNKAEAMMRMKMKMTQNMFKGEQDQKSKKRQEKEAEEGLTRIRGSLQGKWGRHMRRR